MLDRKTFAAPKQKPELLAPAGRMETFYAAIEAGADAVYLGVQNFNARMRAQNFTLDDLPFMIAWAHEKGRKVYTTLNTLIKQQELPELIELIDDLRRMGPDALIIQDLGVYRLVRRMAPELPLHASTQMTIHNLDGALQAQCMGFERVILARELTLDEIRAIRGACTMELETFIHGALCYSISGQCLFSSYAHGKSANRGRCSQPCRRLYETENSEESACFSMHDLEAAPILAQLISAGIRSFKIEGRLKPAETIAQIVKAYRILIDAFPRITREVIEEARNRLDVAVGREPSTGYYLSPTPSRLLGGGETQSGRTLGEAQYAGPGRFALVPSSMVKAGDRLRIQTARDEAPKGFVVRNIYIDGRTVKRCRPGRRIELEAPFHVPAGSIIVKAADADAVERGATKRFERWQAEIVRPSRAVFPARLELNPRGEVLIHVEAGGAPLSIKHAASWESSLSPAEAVRLLSMEDEAYPIRIEAAADADTDDLPMTVEEVEALRTSVICNIIERLDAQFSEIQEEISRPLPAAPAEAYTERFVRFLGLQEAKALFDTQEETAPPFAAILPLDAVGHPEFQRFLLRPGMRDTLLLALPTFSFRTEARKQEAAWLKRALDLGVRRFEVSNLSHFHMLHATGRKRLFMLVSPAIGCLNRACLEQLMEMGASMASYAMEGDAENLDELLALGTASRLALTVYGPIPLFQSRAPGPAGIMRLRLTEPGEQLRMERQGELLHVMPVRPLSLRHLAGDYAQRGLGGLLYDLSFTDGIKRMRNILEAKAGYEPQQETMMNFTRGLE